MRKTTILISAISLTTLGVYLVSVSYAKPLAPPLRIGVMVSDSGPLYFAGPIQRAAAKLAVADLEKAEEPVTIVLDFEDLGDSDSEFENATNSLARFKPNVTLAPIEPASAIRFQKFIGSTPTLATSAAPEKVDNQNSFFRLCPSQSQELISLAQYIVDSGAANIAIAFSDDDYGRSTMRTLAMAFALRGIGKIKLAPITESKILSQAKPDALVLASMEQSIQFFDEYSKWTKKPKQLYLVPGNLANYSSFRWSEELTSAIAITANSEVPSSFRNRLAESLKRPALQDSNNPVVLLGYKTYQAITLAGDSYRRARSAVSSKIKEAIASYRVGSDLLFTDAGFLKQASYRVYKYSAKGTFTAVGEYAPKQ